MENYTFNIRYNAWSKNAKFNNYHPQRSGTFGPINHC